MKQEDPTHDALMLLGALGDDALRYVVEYIAHLEGEGDIGALVRWQAVAAAIQNQGSAKLVNVAAESASLRLH